VLYIRHGRDGMGWAALHLDFGAPHCVVLPVFWAEDGWVDCLLGTKFGFFFVQKEGMSQQIGLRQDLVRSSMCEQTFSLGQK
jgi:hypothetical protein